MKVKQEVPSFGNHYFLKKQLIIFPPDEYSDDEGDGDKPLTMEEFMQKAMMKLESSNKPTHPKTNKSNYASGKRR